mmetsp:Transcript_13746/g.24162  ORF Transcript_13746/g.24162 Transcript_13746/m.24162 type:complete len:216 (-) Transcript_13746:672-1319(-)
MFSRLHPAPALVQRSIFESQFLKSFKGVTSWITFTFFKRFFECKGIEKTCHSFPTSDWQHAMGSFSRKTNASICPFFKRIEIDHAIGSNGCGLSNQGFKVQKIKIVAIGREDTQDVLAVGRWIKIFFFFSYSELPIYLLQTLLTRSSNGVYNSYNPKSTSKSHGFTVQKAREILYNTTIDCHAVVVTMISLFTSRDVFPANLGINTIRPEHHRSI